MRAYCLMHVPFEGPGLIEQWFADRGVTLNRVRLYEGENLPDPDRVDFLLVMGGPMNIYEEEKYPFLEAEKAFLKTCILSGKKILGICLGAQLLADVLGSPIYPNPEKEIGWFPVSGDRERVPGSFVPFHWHGETFDLPEGSVHIGSSLVCRNQGFAYGENVLALQFHLEVDEALVEGLLEHAAADLTEDDWVQSPEEIRAGLSNIEKNTNILSELLQRFTGI